MSLCLCHVSFSHDIRGMQAQAQAKDKEKNEIIVLVLGYFPCKMRAVMIALVLVHVRARLGKTRLYIYSTRSAHPSKNVLPEQNN